MAYVAIVKNDLFALGMGAFGAFGGLGFPLGQTVQVWGRSARPFGARVQSWIDWWKVMELTFGAAAGGALGVGWWALREIGISIGREALPHVSASFQIALLAVFACIFVAAAIAAEPLLGGLDTRFWLLFVVWFQTAATVVLKGSRPQVLIPSDDMAARHGIWGAPLRGAGAALPVEILFVVMAGLLTWVVTA